MKESKKYFPGYAEIPVNRDIIIEHTLRYADIDEIKMIIAEYGIKLCREVWEKNLVPDSRLLKLNHFLAKFIFNITDDENVLNDYFLRHSEKRSERIANVSNR